MKLINNVAIITGAASGIGKATALEFVKQGAKVVICDINQKEGKKLQDQIKKQGYLSIFIKADVRKKEDIEKVIKITLKKFKKIDILVNNAGLFYEKEIYNLTEKEWTKVMDTNLKGMYILISAISKYMMKNKKGKIISIGSIFGEVGYNKMSVYSAVNGGIIGLTKSIAIELAPYKINVNVVSPGIIATKMNEKQLLDLKIKKKILSNIPLERIGLAEDVADSIVFLASNKSNFITGHNLVIDGGWTIH